MSNNDATNLILWHVTMHSDGEQDEHPGQEGRPKDDESEEAQACVWIASRPDIDQRARQGLSKKGHGKEWR